MIGLIIVVLLVFILLVEFVKHRRHTVKMRSPLLLYKWVGGKPYVDKRMIGEEKVVLKDYLGPLGLGVVGELVDNIIPFKVDETEYPKTEAEWERQNEINKRSRRVLL